MGVSTGPTWADAHLIRSNASARQPKGAVVFVSKNMRKSNAVMANDSATKICLRQKYNNTNW